MIKWFGATRPGVWTIKHVIAPLDRQLYRWTGGKLVTPGKAAGPVLLLTTTGRKSGKPRTTPVFYLRDANRFIICNANPGFERTNPWVLNLRANPNVIVQVGEARYICTAYEAVGAEIEHYWKPLTRMWPAYQAHYDLSGERAIFVLENAQELQDEDGG